MEHCSVIRVTTSQQIGDGTNVKIHGILNQAGTNGAAVSSDGTAAGQIVSVTDGQYVRLDPPVYIDGDPFIDHPGGAGPVFVYYSKIR